ncbi:unnamed protein product [Victoria cruziana]
MVVRRGSSMPLPFIFLVAVIFVLLLPPVSLQNTSDFPCRPPNHNFYPFCNSSLPVSVRARSLISLLTLQEKIQQLSNNASSIPRLGIPAFQWWSESLHGIATDGPGVNFSGVVSSATVFPQVILTVASFNRTLWNLIAKAIAAEARAMYNVGQAGLTYWAPNINVFRDPRWGRGQETPGEDPFVVGAYAVEYVKGFQGEYGVGGSQDGFGGLPEKRFLEGRDGGGSLMLSACCKHFIAYDLEKWENFTRYTFNAQVSMQDMEDTYEPPFKSCIQDGHASCLMCSYNEVNGVPACELRDLFQTARKQWGFNGYITSDCDAVATIYEYQKYAPTPEDAVARALKAGMDINCGTYLLRHTQAAVEKGKLTEFDIDNALFNLFIVQLRLGVFDGDSRKQRYGGVQTSGVCSSMHRQLALEAARQGIVLLKNEKNFLPLTASEVESLAIIGPAANDTNILGGDYTGFPCDARSILYGFQNYVKNVSYASGCRDVACDSSDGLQQAVDIAKMVDAVIVVAGIDLSQEKEDLDRTSLLLPGKQQDLALAIAKVSRRPVILVLVGGGPVDVSFARDNELISSILWIGYPGEVGGQAVTEVIFGEHNPGGRLPVTWYPESFTSVPMNNMNMRPDASRGYPGRTYRFYTGEAIYEFGHGLSYTNYSYKIISAPDKVSVVGELYENYGYYHFHVNELPSCEKLAFQLQVSVFNLGDRHGSHVVMLFSSGPKGFKGAPRKQLIGFERVHVKSQKTTNVSFLLRPCEHLRLADENGHRILALGAHVVMVGGEKHTIYIDN